ncbi:Protein CBG22844 [Caenorhabditis briggsae]|uniref:Protein CBG22844 n=1 Tax=Caenorhabditis briggsae TaxID=6238 RepID=A8Y368_CAEBR|nr:Protein CBG22844 [Caenorhabditis briggsae]CAP39337.1 Protein CBG22844 [Caenorhabditis briggsae]
MNNFGYQNIYSWWSTKQYKNKKIKINRSVHLCVCLSSHLANLTGQRTCNRCASSTTTTTSLTGTCTSYNADSSTACTAWAANGFCTNTFYTLTQRKAYCARTCRICYAFGGRQDKPVDDHDSQNIAF